MDEYNHLWIVRYDNNIIKWMICQSQMDTSDLFLSTKYPYMDKRALLGEKSLLMVHYHGSDYKACVLLETRKRQSRKKRVFEIKF